MLCGDECEEEEKGLGAAGASLLGTIGVLGTFSGPLLYASLCGTGEVIFLYCIWCLVLVSLVSVCKRWVVNATH